MRWLRRLFCMHRNTETQEVWNGEYWAAFYWKCHACGAESGRPI